MNRRRAALGALVPLTVVGTLAVYTETRGTGAAPSGAVTHAPATATASPTSHPSPSPRHAHGPHSASRAPSAPALSGGGVADVPRVRPSGPRPAARVSRSAAPVKRTPTPAPTRTPVSAPVLPSEGS